MIIMDLKVDEEGGQRLWVDSHQIEALATTNDLNCLLLKKAGLILDNQHEKYFLRKTILINMYIMHQFNICFVIFFLVLQQQQNYNWQWMVVPWMEVSPPISGVPVPEVKVLKMTISYKVTYCTQIFDLLIFTNLSYLDRSQGRLHLYRNWDRQGPGWYMYETKL